MTPIELVAAVVAVLGVTAIAWLFSLQRRQHRLLDHHREWIDEALQSIVGEANRKREHIHAVVIGDVAATFTQLCSLVEDQPGAVLSDAEEMQRLWNELDALGAEAVNDAQAGMLTARAGKLADRIEELAAEIHEKLE